MDYIGKAEITVLSSRQSGSAVSIYMPTYRTGRQVEQNATRFKNLLRKARNELVQSGKRDREVVEFLSPAQKLVENSPFWQHQSDGLALFIGPRGLEYYRLPVVFDELVVTSDRFHLKPLLSLLISDGQFYLLALSKKKVKLYQGSRFGLSELDPPRMPKSLAEILQYDLFEKQPQFHTGTPSHGGARRAAVFFGTGDADADEKEQLHIFFRELSKSLRSTVLANERAPLVLAGVEYMLPIYRKVCEYPSLLESQIAGSPKGASVSWFHQRAWPIVEAYFRQDLEQSVQRYRALMDSHNPMASDNFELVFWASAEGRVESLFVPLGMQLWGKVDFDAGKLEVRDKPLPGDQDLLDLAAIHVFSKNGMVYAVPPEQMPNHEKIGAIFRY